MRAILAGLALMCLAFTASARPYTIEDTLKLESYGQVLIAPGGRLALVERRDRYDSAARYSYGYLTRRMTSRIMLANLSNPGALKPAFPQEAGAGYWAGAFSPRGDKVTVFRLKDDRLRLGVLDLSLGSVRWLKGAPDLPLSAPAPIWLDENTILYLRFLDERLAFILDHPGTVQKTTSARWAAAAGGQVPSADLAQTRGTWRTPRSSMRELVELNVESGSERVFLTDAIEEFITMATAHLVAVIVEGAPAQPDAGTPIFADYQSRRRRLMLVDLQSGAVSHPCARCDLKRNALAVSREGKVAAWSRVDGEPWSDARIRIFGSRISASSEMAEIPAPRSILWLGERLLLQRQNGSWGIAGNDGRMASIFPQPLSLIAANGTTAWLSGPDNLWRLESSGRKTRVHAGRVDRIGLDHQDPASVGTRALRVPEQPVLMSDLRDQRRVAFGFAGRRTSLDFAEDGEVLAVSPSRRSAIILTTDAHGVGRLELVTKGRRPVVIDQISTHLADVDLPEAIRTVRKGVDKGDLIDWLFLPPGDAPHPLVIIPYQGGLQSRRVPRMARPEFFGSATNVSLLVARGYAVLVPGLPAGPMGAPQTTLVRDLDAAVDAAVATGRVDAERMAIYGHSYGGVNAVTLAARSMRYRAVIAASGINDFAAGYGSVPPAQRVKLSEDVPLDAAIAWYETGQARLEVAPWEDPARYQQASSFFAAQRITAPLLLIAGDIDYAPVDQAERLFVALDRLGRDVTLLRFYGEGHVVQSPANIRLQWSTVLSFLDRTMGRMLPLRQAPHALIQ